MKLEEFVMREDFKKHIDKMESSERFGDAQYKLIDKETRFALKKVNAMLKEPKRKKLLLDATKKYKPERGNTERKGIVHPLPLTKPVLTSHLILAAVKVNDALGCEIELPCLNREKGGWAYSPMLNVISYPYVGGNLEIIDMQLMHEYCHAIQFSAPYPHPWLKNQLVAEGFAEAFSRHLAAKHSPLEREVAFIMLKHSISDITHENILNIYLYDLGFASFFLAQQKHGAKIYKEIIRTENPFEYLLDHL